MQHSTVQTNQQLLMMAATIFISVTAAVVVSTLLIMSLMKSEIAGAMSMQAPQPTTVTSQSGNTCPAPLEESTVPAPSTPTAPMHAFMPKLVPAGKKHHATTNATNSYNTTNNTTTNTNITTTETYTKTVINDSFNDNSKLSHNTVTNSNNPVIVKDTTINVDSNNHTAVNSGNVLTTIVHDTTTNIASNNTTNSNNTTEHHVLSDNVVVVTPEV